MKNKVVLLIVLMMVFAAQTCFALPWKEIPEEDIAIGGVYLGASKEYVESIYGESDEVEYENLDFAEVRLEKHNYGNSFFVTYDRDRNSVVEVESTGNNGLRVPAGFAVGDSISDVKNYYKGAGKAQGKNKQWYTCHWYLNLTFETDNNGIIKKIDASANLV